MMMTSSVAVGTVPVSQFSGLLHNPPAVPPGVVVAIQTTAGLSVPVILTVTVWVDVALWLSVTVTV